MTTPQNWDAMYTADAEPPPWDIGRPQQAFERLADARAAVRAAARRGLRHRRARAARRRARRGRHRRRHRTARHRARPRQGSGPGPAGPLRGRGRAEPRSARPDVRHRHRQRGVPRLRRRGPGQVRHQPGSVLRPGGRCYLLASATASRANGAPAGSPRTSCAPRSATAGPSSASKRTPSRSTRPARPHRAGLAGHHRAGVTPWATARRSRYVVERLTVTTAAQALRAPG